MNTCKTCKWWKKNASSFGDCNCNKFHYDDSSIKINDDMFLYTSLSHPQADIFYITGQNFGCIHWENKE